MAAGDAERIGKVHVITDEVLQSRFLHEDLALLAARGGADRIQFREKRPLSREVCTMTLERIRLALTGHGACLMVDDRVREAMDSGALGVHLGRDDMPAAEARAMLGPDAVIGLTANSLEEAREAAGKPVDYLGVGPIFPTRSKKKPAESLGLAGLQKIAQAVTMPIVAIGGIHAGNAAEVIAHGACGVAVLSAVVCSEDPEGATRDIVEAVTGRVAREGNHDD